jgi:hypothetical protein
MRRSLAAQSKFIKKLNSLQFSLHDSSTMPGNSKQAGRAGRAANGNGSRAARVGVRSNNPNGRSAARQRQQSLGVSSSGKQAQAAAAYASAQKSGQAQVHRTGPDSCRIVHRELIASVTGTVAFTVGSSIALNPGLVTSFPWLSTQAAGWERYKFNALRFCYYTRTGSNIPGSVMMAPDFDASDAAPQTEVAASSYQHCEEDAPWKDIKCILPARELMGDMKEKYIRTTAIAANQDIKTYDAGNFFLCTVDGTAVPWGKLWVEYDVTLITPQSPPGGFQASGLLVGVGAKDQNQIFGPIATQLNTGPITLSSSLTGTVTIGGVSIGQELLISSYITGTVITVFAASAPTGMTLRTDASATSMFNAGATSACEWQTFTVTALNPTLTINCTSATVATSALSVTVLSPIPTI